MSCKHPEDHHKSGEDDGHKPNGSYNPPHQQGIFDTIVSPNSSEKIQENDDYKCGFRKGRDGRNGK